ncbi:adenylyl-sulfate kinase [Kibdelosporangium philippinense]|uniref:Adenylyl-sulfate kinase n=1 Tax=Kibdelosporangium philippinense TaxID=211113 RepID=A0ABS8Z5B3_9PSEU|nr:adenylyl-sulfate kinase [Kibdelosporangium philippinense]MCE7003045.1 adenylyl-sulfate kinase [Kibdelosporangium philippinense]
MVSVLRVIACGSVDDGKSTLIGRLLATTGGATKDELDYATQTRRGGSTIPVGEVDYSLLTDGLEAEHEQGITIDVAYRFLDLPSGRRVIIADAPGHEQYTRNMAVAASTADVAILLVDATKGVREQTYRHLAICALMGVRTVIAAVNKLDAVSYDRALFTNLSNEVLAAANDLGVTASVLPASALGGDNVVEPSPNLPWYKGPTLLEALSTWEPVESRADGDYRLPVQYVIRADDFRGFAGMVVGSTLQPGDPVAVAGSGVESKIDRVLGPGGNELDMARPGTPVTVTLTDDVDIRRGDLLTTPDTRHNGLAPATACSATLVWTAEEPLRHGRSYLLSAGSRTVPAVVTNVRDRLEVVSGTKLAARTLGLNDIGTVELTTDTPICLDSYKTCRETGSFLLVDRVSKETVAAGMVRYALRRGRNVVPHAYTVDRDARQQQKGQRSTVLWLTGLPGSGKSTLADALERRLHALGLHTYVLDGDNVRSGLNKDLGFTPEARAENVRRVAEVSRILLDSGLIVIVALVSPFRTDRAVAKSLFQPGDFAEVWVNTPADVCASRDPKGLYAKAKAGTLPNMTGVGQAYEPPEHPDLVVDGSGSLDDAADELCAFLRS